MTVRIGLLCILFFWGTNALSNNYQTPMEGERVVYGNDDRKDLFEVSDSFWLERADSTVALIPSSKVKKAAVGYKISTSVYGSVYQLCKNEPFYNQTYAANCSASLIAPDLIMTAGHCVQTVSDCNSYKYVFNYSYSSEDSDASLVDDDDVYSCKEVVASQFSSADFAIVRLDRPVVGHTPLKLNRSSTPIKNGDGLVLIGNPSGIPTKIAAGAVVTDDSRKGYFVADTDSYGGNSGSAVFNSKTGLIEGILVRGEQDFVKQGGCNKSKVCKDTQSCRGEDVTRVEEVFKYLPSDV
jgi:hypothetical protein